MDLLTCNACDKEAPPRSTPRAKCVFGDCKGSFIETGQILALAFKHREKQTVSGVEYEPWDVLCRACMSHELWGPTVYYDCPEVQIVGMEEEDIERWGGEERVISCSYCGTVLLDDAIVVEEPDPEAMPGGWYDVREQKGS